jgi:hypothetical protein
MSISMIAIIVAASTHSSPYTDHLTDMLHGELKDIRPRSIDVTVSMSSGFRVYVLFYVLNYRSRHMRPDSGPIVYTYTYKSSDLISISIQISNIP